MSENGGMLALNQNWLDTTTVSYNNRTSGGDGYISNNIQTHVTYGTTGLPGTMYWYYPSWSYPVYVQSPSRPIKLTLSEVERLRKLAKADSKVKAILAKFTDQIEITVDFE